MVNVTVILYLTVYPGMPGVDDTFYFRSDSPMTVGEANNYCTNISSYYFLAILTKANQVKKAAQHFYEEMLLNNTKSMACCMLSLSWHFKRKSKWFNWAIYMIIVRLYLYMAMHEEMLRIFMEYYFLLHLMIIEILLE